MPVPMPIFLHSEKIKNINWNNPCDIIIIIILIIIFIVLLVLIFQLIKITFKD